MSGFQRSGKRPDPRQQNEVPPPRGPGFLGPRQQLDQYKNLMATQGDLSALPARAAFIKKHGLTGVDVPDAHGRADPVLAHLRKKMDPTGPPNQT